MKQNAKQKLSNPALLTGADIYEMLIGDDDVESWKVQQSTPFLNQIARSVLTGSPVNFSVLLSHVDRLDTACSLASRAGFSVTAEVTATITAAIAYNDSSYGNTTSVVDVTLTASDATLGFEGLGQ